MDAKKYESIVQLFDGCDTRLIIPLYQRTTIGSLGTANDCSMIL